MLYCRHQCVYNHNRFLWSLLYLYYSCNAHDMEEVSSKNQEVLKLERTYCHEFLTNKIKITIPIILAGEMCAIVECYYNMMKLCLLDYRQSK